MMTTEMNGTTTEIKKARRVRRYYTTGPNGLPEIYAWFRLEDARGYVLEDPTKRLLLRAVHPLVRRAIRCNAEHVVQPGEPAMVEARAALARKLRLKAQTGLPLPTE